MSNILHIKDAYFELPEKCKDDIGCMITLLGIHLQQNKDVSEDDTCNIEYEFIEKENYDCENDKHTKNFKGTY